MATLQHFISVLVIILSLSVDGANGYYVALVDQCHYTSPDLSHLEFNRFHVFNKAEYVRFNSTVGKFEGYTARGVLLAERWNNDTAYMAFMRAVPEIFCRPNNQGQIDAILTQTAEPQVTLNLTKASSSGHPAMLVCSAYNFYPKLIKLTWYRDGQEAPGNVISSEELANGDWYHQIHSHLEFTPKAGEKVTCVVEHPSLKEPRVIQWETPPMTEPEKIMIGVGAAALLLGVIIAAAGIIFYLIKARVCGVCKQESGVFVANDTDSENSSTSTSSL